LLKLLRRTSLAYISAQRNSSALELLRRASLVLELLHRTNLSLTFLHSRLVAVAISQVEQSRLRAFIDSSFGQFFATLTVANSMASSDTNVGGLLESHAKSATCARLCHPRTILQWCDTSRFCDSTQSR
jgi:hypothetical protein